MKRIYVVVAVLAVAGAMGLPSAASATTATDSRSLLFSFGAEPPSSTSAPVLSGFAEVGAALNVTSGGWNGGVPAISYQWGDNSSGADALIPGDTGPNHTVTAAELGNTVYASVTDTTGGGATTVTVRSATITAANPHILMTDFNLVTLDQDIVSTTTGTWSGASDLTYTFQWFASSDNLDSIAGDGLPNLSNGFYLRATTRSIQIPYQARGYRIYAIVTAHSASLGSAFDSTNGDYGDVLPAISSSASIAHIGVATIPGSPTIGKPTTVAELPDYTRKPTSITYGWYTSPKETNDATAASLHKVGSGASYTPVAADAGQFLYCGIDAATELFGTSRLLNPIDYVAVASGTTPSTAGDNVPPAPFADASGIDSSNQGTVTASQDGNDVLVSVPDAAPGDAVTIYGYSSPQLLGTFLVNSSRQISVNAGVLPAGRHHLVVLSSTGAVIGWAAISATPTLPFTGFDAAPWTLGGTLLLLIGLTLPPATTYRRNRQIHYGSFPRH